MPICPKCKQEIDHLQCVMVERHLYEYRFTGIPKVSDYEEIDLLETNPEKYTCPKCHEILFTDEDAANDFLIEE